MNRSAVLTSLFVAVGAAAVLLNSDTSSAQSKSKAAVLVELFTSEGCSSCPPADRLLAEFDERQPLAGVEIIALGQHVDYWDGLGWRDRFSSAEATRRQPNYSLHFGQNRVYTPQMIVDGAQEFVGSDKGQAQQAILQAARRAKARLRIESGADAPPAVGRWAIHVDSAPPTLDVFIALTESGLSNKVSSGENRGRLLRHASVVHVLQKIGEMDSSPPSGFQKRIEIPLDPSWNKDQLRIVAFVQAPNAGRVLGATISPAVAPEHRNCSHAPAQADAQRAARLSQAVQQRPFFVRGIFRRKLEQLGGVVIENSLLVAIR